MQVRRALLLFFVAWMCLLSLCVRSRPASANGEDTIVIKVVRLHHADAQTLASVLRPLLTKDGQIAVYSPTNTLIIKDRKSLVEALVRVIKGPDGP